MSKKIEIEIQHFEGCPNGPALIKNVREVVKEFRDQIDYKELLVENYDLAKEIGFRGSPTLLINGEDFEGRPSPENPGMNCRLYPNGVPKSDEIKKRIASLLN